MKKLLILSLILMSSSWSGIAYSAKKYRYIKREHGVRFQGNIPIEMGAGGFAVRVELKGAYTYNWRGWLEFGPYFEMAPQIMPQFMLGSLNGGIMTEYNIIKNRGKRKIIPTVGVKIGMDKSGGAPVGLESAGGGQTLIAVGPYAALKLFVGKRTPFTVSLDYLIRMPMNFMSLPGMGMTHHPRITMGFSYYFDFYKN